MSLFCSLAMIFYYWTREFNQAIVFLSGQDCQWICEIFGQKSKVQIVEWQVSFTSKFNAY